MGRKATDDERAVVVADREGAIRHWNMLHGEDMADATVAEQAAEDVDGLSDDEIVSSAALVLSDPSVVKVDGQYVRMNKGRPEPL